MIPLLALLLGASAPSPDAFVLARDVAAGELLSETAFRPRRDTDRAAPRGALSPAEADGMEATHRLLAGTAVRRIDLRPRRAIRRGDPVTVSFRSGALSISTQGKALGDAAVGASLRVLTASTHRTIDAVAEAAGRVRVE